jgi:hypothetical protein
VRPLLLLLAASLLLAGCSIQATPSSPTSRPAPAHTAPAKGTPDVEQAKLALGAYLLALSEGRYAEAAATYGGDYSHLAGYNPTLSPDDDAALLEAACRFNGYQCLRAVQIAPGAVAQADQAQFLVSFITADGQPFVLAPPPGAEEQPVRQFPFTVVATPDGYRVLELPPYVS